MVRYDESEQYNVHTIVHYANIEQLQVTIERMRKTCGVANYRVLVIEKEPKKVPPTYIR
jgi:hypothetical protein